MTSDHLLPHERLMYEHTGEAEARLAFPPEAVLRWPFPDLDALTGPLGLRGEIWFLAAVSGSGKTTFVLSLIERLRRAGKRLYVMPLETEAAAFTTALACAMLAHEEDPATRILIDPGAINSGEWLAWPNHAQIRARLAAAYRSLRQAPYRDQVVIPKDSHVTVRGLCDAFEDASACGADLLIVDHIDHIDAGTGHVAEQSRAICHAAHRMARETGITVLFTSQINFDMLRNPDRLAKYMAPQIQHLKYPTTKVEVATGIIGLSRALTPRAEGESPKEYADKLAAARRGAIEPQEVLVPGVAVVNAMKLRHRGQNTGKVCHLAYEQGMILPLAERHRYQTGMGGRMLRAV